MGKQEKIGKSPGGAPLIVISLYLSPLAKRTARHAERSLDGQLGLPILLAGKGCSPLRRVGFVRVGCPRTCERPHAARRSENRICHPRSATSYEVLPELPLDESQERQPRSGAVRLARSA